MKTPRDTLWQLIHRLSPAEKRYFKTHFASPDNQLTLLFDTLNAQPVYDEQLCRTSLGLNAAHYKVLKVQLQDLLLRSLVAHQGKRNLRSKVRIGLEEVDLLLERELFAEATRRLNRLDQLCARYGFTLYRYEITEKLQAITHLETDLQDEAVQQYYGQLQHLQQTLNQKQELHAIRGELEAWTPFTPNRFAFGQRILKQLEAVPAQYLDFQSQLEWMQSIATCYEILGQDAQAKAYREEILANFARDASLQDRLPFSYLRALRAQASPLVHAPDAATLGHSIDAAQRLIARFPQYSPHLIYFYWAEIRSHFHHHQWSRISSSLEERSTAHLHHYQQEKSNVATDIYLVLTCTHLIQGNHDQAAEYLDQLDRQKSYPHVYHLITISVLRWILCWQNAAYHELKRELRNHKRRLLRRQLLQRSPFARALVVFFQDLTRQPTAAPRIATKFLLELSAYSTDLLFPYFSFLQLERWLQAIAGKKPWPDVFQS